MIICPKVAQQLRANFPSRVQKKFLEKTYTSRYAYPFDERPLIPHRVELIKTKRDHKVAFQRGRHVAHVEAIGE